MAADYSTLAPQLIGGALSIAGTIPNEQDRLQRRIAMGGEDPALAAVRRTLAAQNAQTAMAVAASQQGVNPALASRNAQQALAQTQIQTNAEIARLGMGSAQQARSSDPKGQKIGAALQGVGQLANVFGTGMAAQNAGLANGPQGAQMDKAGKFGGDPAMASLGSALASPGGGQFQTMPVGGETAGALAAPGMGGVPTVQTQMPAGPDGMPLFDPNAPSAAQGVPSAQLQPGGMGGSGVSTLPAPAAPVQAAPAVPQVQIPSMEGIQMPSTAPVATQADVMSQMGAPGGAAQPQFAPPTAQPAGGNLGPQSRGVPSLEGGNPDVPEPQFRPSDALPPELTSNPGFDGLLQAYDELAAVGDQAGMDAVVKTLRALQGFSGIQGL